MHGTIFQKYQTGSGHFKLKGTGLVQRNRSLNQIICYRSTALFTSNDFTIERKKITILKTFNVINALLFQFVSNQNHNGTSEFIRNTSKTFDLVTS